MNYPLITAIQRYCIHDGQGIRTVVFFKGCPLSCRWCHNPENISFSPEVLWNSAFCRGCMSCVNTCPEHAITAEESEQGIMLLTDIRKCSACGTCTEECLYNARSLAGKQYPIRELTQILCRDMQFYENSGGGVTLSGGEVMAQDQEYIQELARSLYEKGISVDIDTCGMASIESFEAVLKYTDTFLYDIKCMDSAVHKKYTGADNRQILDNLCRLSAMGANIALRLPLIPGVNMEDSDILRITEFLKTNSIDPIAIHLLPYHELGQDKKKRLSKYAAEDGKQNQKNEMAEKEAFRVPDMCEIEHIKCLFEGAGFSRIRIGG